MPDNLPPFDPEPEDRLDTLLSGYANVDPPDGATERWRRALRSAPPRERFLGLSARVWAAACGLCLTGMLILGGTAWQRSAAPVPGIVFAPPAPPPPPPAVNTSVPVRAARRPLTLPPEGRALHPTAQERLLVRLVADQPAALTQLFAEPVFQPLTPSEDAKPTGENQ